MDAKEFGAFLAQVRRERNMTQAELAQQLHVTDKAVSRWERGIGLPDINTLEPLADVLGLTLADLMHCHDSRQKMPLLPFLWKIFHHAAPPAHCRLAFCAYCSSCIKHCTCPVGNFCLSRQISCALADSQRWFASGRRLDVLPGHFPLFAGFEFLSLELWNNFEQTGYYRRWGEVNLFIIHAMSFGTPLTRLMRLVLDLLFFFCFGFLLPCCEAWLILLN